MGKDEIRMKRRVVIHPEATRKEKFKGRIIELLLKVSDRVGVWYYTRNFDVNGRLRDEK